MFFLAIFEILKNLASLGFWTSQVLGGVHNDARSYGTVVQAGESNRATGRGPASELGGLQNEAEG